MQNSRKNISHKYAHNFYTRTSTPAHPAIPPDAHDATPPSLTFNSTHKSLTSISYSLVSLVMGVQSSDNPTPVCAVATALERKAAGNSLDYLRLMHMLSGKDPIAIANVLTGLTHFTAALHGPHAHDIHGLVSAALDLDLSVCAAATDASYPALDALQLFAVNLASAHTAYVERLFDMFAQKAFVMNVDIAGPVVKRIYVVVSAILKAYPTATVVLVDVLRRRYPHPVRGKDEHVSYARVLLHLAGKFKRIAAGVLDMVFERLGAVEALVGDVLVEGKLTKEAEKLESILLEFVAFVQSDVGYNFNQIYAAFESAIVPVEGTRFVPYIVMHAAMKAGVVMELVEKLRVGFFDLGVSERLREKFLQHSSAVIIRAEMIETNEVLDWVMSVAEWLNRYADVCERNRCEEVDTDVHYLFYSACCALMTTISKRKEAFSSGGLESADIMHQMRLLRIMSCALNPMLVIPGEIVEDFVGVVSEVGGMDLSAIVEENKGRFAPSRTRYGSPNQFSYVARCPDLELPAVREKLERYIRSDSAIGARVGGHDGDQMGIDVPAYNGFSDLLAEHVPSRILSTTVA